MVLCLAPLNRVVVGCALFSFFSSGIIQFGLTTCTLTTVKEHFDVSYTAMAIAVICFQISQIICSFFLPSLEQRWSGIPAETLCALGMFLCVLGAIIYGCAAHYAMLVIGQLINGIGAASVYLYMPSMFSRLVANSAMLSLCVAKSFAMTPIGIVVASISCNQAVDSWRWLFIGFGLCLFIPCAVFFAIGRSYRSDDPRHKIADPPTFTEVRKAVMQEPRAVLSVSGVSCTAFTIAAYSTFLAAYFEKHIGESKETASLVLAATVPAVALGTMVGGKVSQSCGWTNRKLLVFLASCCASAFAIFQVVLPGDVRTLWLNILVLVIAMFCMFLCAGPAVAVVAQMLPRHLVSHGQSMLNIITRAIGGVLGPIVIAVILDAGESYSTAFFIVSWMMLVGGALYGLAAYVCPADLVVDHQVDDVDQDPDNGPDVDGETLELERTNSQNEVEQHSEVVDDVSDVPYFSPAAAAVEENNNNNNDSEVAVPKREPFEPAKT